MLGLIVAGAVVTASSPATIDLQSAKQESAMALAPELLSESVRLQVADGMSQRRWAPFQSYAFAWWTAALPSGQFCERTLFTMQGENPKLEGESAPPGARLTLTPVAETSQFAIPGPGGCGDASGYVSVNARRTAATLQALERLRNAIAAARGVGAPLPFKITCREERAEEGRCTDARQALAGLPLTRLGAVMFDSGRTKQIEPGLSQSVPGTFEEPDTATVAFGPGDGDAYSWRTELQVDHGRLVAVNISRTMIIYH